MTTYQKVSLTLLRISLGGLFLYAGLSHLLEKGWSAAGYINSAQNLVPLFHFFASPSVLPITNFLNVWGLTLIGLCLILGLLVRVAAPLGALMMLLYYLVLPFPMPNTHAFLIDEHIVYILGLLVLAAFNTGKTWGLDQKLFNRLANKY